MEILGQLWWIVTVAVIIAIAFFVPLRNKRRRERLLERAERQHKQDRATLTNFVDDLGRNERIAYMALPSRAARLAWLTKNYPEFMETVSRHEPDREIDSVVAFYLDVKLLNGVSIFPNRDNAIRAYRSAGSAMSLTEYQDVIDKRIEDYRKAAAERMAEQRKLAEAREEARREAQRKQSQAKKSAKNHWKSLSKEQQTAFRQAKGISARKKILRESPSADLHLNELYYLVMQTQFRDIATNYSNSIDSCASVTKYADTLHSGSRYDDGGRTNTDTYSSNDSGSEYSHHSNDSSHHSNHYSSSDSGGYSSSSDSGSSYSSSDSSSSCSFD